MESLTKRKYIKISCQASEFEEKYNEKMSFFNDKEIISINLVEHVVDFSNSVESYIVFYKD